MLPLAILVSTVLAATALPAEFDPQNLAFMLDEDDFDDQLDGWLENEELKWVNVTLAEDGRDARSGCTFNVRGDLGQPQPVYLHRNRLLMPTGNSGQIRLNAGEQIRIGCPGPSRTIRHPQMNNIQTAYATVNCNSGNQISSSILRANGAFGGLTCNDHAFHTAQETSARCFGNNIVIRVGFIVDNVFHIWYHSCFDRNRLEVLYVWYEQNAAHAVHQTGVDRPFWLPATFFPGVNINNLYTQAQQRVQIGRIVGTNMVDRYITSEQFLARGHLSAKSDYPFATAQRATFYFINAAPQWQPFNAGNWMNLEQNLRARIGRANYNTVIYTGTFGVTQLRDASNRLRDIFLHENGRQVPVPLYFYKVVYDAGRRLGTAFISINNPYYTAAEVRSLQFCTDRCRNNNAFSWLRWLPDRIDLGFSFCCTIADFRRRIGHLPNFTVNGLLT